MIRKVWLFVGVALAGCSGIDVSEDYDRSQDFARLRTWAWAPPAPQADGSSGYSEITSLTHKRITSAVEGQLAMKQYKKVESDKADFWVRHYASTGQKLEAYPGYNGWYGYDDDVVVVQEGTIVVDILSPKNKRLMWRGKATSVISDDMTPEERETRISESVQKILAQFPPQR